MAVERTLIEHYAPSSDFARVLQRKSAARRAQQSLEALTR